jgi:hypothetical protein
MEINGIFIHNGQPQNGATAKLWEAAGFVSPPEYDDEEPDGGYQVGGDITTGQSYGGDGAYRFTSVDDGEYYVSVEYLSHRVWQYYTRESVDDILTTEGDILIRGESGLERKAIGSEDQVLAISGGAIDWITLTFLYGIYEQLLNSNDTERGTTSSSYEKIKETKLDSDYAGGIRIKFKLRITGTTGYAKIYRNGIAIGTQQSYGIEDGGATFSEDFGDVDWSADDLIQVYAYSNIGIGHAYVSNFRFYYCKYVDGAGIPTTSQDP